MKEDLKKCAMFDPTIDNRWLYHFKFSWRDYEGQQRDYLYEYNYY